ncbi:MAG: DUF1844 domain-containing protein [Candidatus Aminicenantes bacterium]|nr:DUF1844 domain-containing protein [Candidatus Aminicenantes bacterium]MDH5715152.1 DUF1844 domain-containing protein [Candidatus Aminicenantes bacterium]
MEKKKGTSTKRETIGKKEEKIKVTDRRIFDREGKLKKEFRKAKKEKPPAEAKEKQQKAEKTITEEKPPKEQKERTTLPPVDFGSFILSLSTTAFIHLGEVADPTGKEKMVNLEAAKQMVDIVQMLKEKTEGNRTQEESALIDNLLYELKLKYMAKAKLIKL